MKFLIMFVLPLTVEKMTVTPVELVNSKLFARSKPGISGPRRLAPGWSEESILSCAAQCQIRFSTKCRSFLYNNVTKLCTPAHAIVSYCPPPTVAEGDLYLCDGCQPQPKFTWVENKTKQRITTKFDLVIPPDLQLVPGNDYLNGSTTISYFYGTNLLSYADATTACDSFNAHLFVPDTMEKVRLFYAIINRNHSTWFGLDDRNSEGKFVWANTGLEIDPDFKKAIFDPGQPDNHNDEDCAYYRSAVSGLNDGKCSLTLRYVCEKQGC